MMNKICPLSPRKHLSFTRTSAGIIAVAALVAASGASADESCDIGLNVTDVTPNPVYVTGFPTNIELTVAFEAPQGIASLTTLEVDFDEKIVYTGTSAPPTSACTGACSDLGDGAGEVTFSAGVNEPGTYALSVTATRLSGPNLTTWCDDEAVEVSLQLVAVEFKAPPALANEYINSLDGRLNGKRRGCVISQIAHNHAQLSLYGPKGGDASIGPYGYDVEQIMHDVDYYLSTCR
jgi:hypothetical protein